MRRLALAIAAGAGIALFAASGSSSEYELVQLVTQRRAHMFHMQSAYWPLLAIKNGDNTDLAAGAKAARTISDAISKFVTLLPAGTAKGEVPSSRAKPEIWSQPAEFRAAADALNTAAINLVDAAKAGDVAAFKARFDAFAQACGGCHGLKPSSGGRFRYPG